METFPPSHELDIVPPTAAVEVGQLESAEGRRVYFHPTLRDANGRTTYLMLRGFSSEWEKDKLQALHDNNVPTYLLPAESDSYTPEEKDYASQTLGQSPREVRSPFAPRNNEVEALVFEPTTKSVLDVMIRAGHDTKEIRQARRAALRGEENALVRNLDVLLETARLNSEAIEKPGTIDEEHKNLQFIFQNAFNFEGQVADTVGHLCEQGPDYYGLRQVADRLQEGVHAELLKELAASNIEVDAMLSDIWQDSMEAARTYNTDLQRNGIYTELHRIGPNIVAIPALVATNYNSGRHGWVDEGSSHTLVEIYAQADALPARHPDVEETLILESKLTELIVGLGLGNSGSRTLVDRCRTKIDEAGGVYIELPADDIAYRTRMGRMTNRQYVIDCLNRQGIKCVDTTPPKKMTAMTEQETMYPRSVHTTVEYHDIAPVKKERERFTMVLGGFSEGEEGLTIDWNASYACSHERMNIELGIDRKGFIPAQFNGVPYEVSGQYVRLTKDEADTHVCVWRFKGEDVEAFKKQKESLQEAITRSQYQLDEELADIDYSNMPTLHRFIFMDRADKVYEDTETKFQVA